MVVALLGLRFVLELALFASIGLVAARMPSNYLIGWFLAVGLAGLAVVIWGVLLAPRRRVNLPIGVRVVLELALFALAASGLALTGNLAWGGVLLVAEVVVLVGLWSMGLPPGSDAGAKVRLPRP